MRACGAYSSPACCLQTVERSLQTDQPGCRGEQDLPDFAFSGGDFASALHQPLVADAEHGFEIRARQALQKMFQLAFIDASRIVHAAQRLDVGLAPDELDSMRAIGKRQADPQVAIRMNEVVGGLQRDAVEAVGNGAQRGSLACFVQPVDNRERTRKREMLPGEWTVGNQIQGFQPHFSSPFMSKGSME